MHARSLLELDGEVAMVGYLWKVCASRLASFYYELISASSLPVISAVVLLEGSARWLDGAKNNGSVIPSARESPNGFGCVCDVFMSV